MQNLPNYRVRPSSVLVSTRGRRSNVPLAALVVACFTASQISLLGPVDVNEFWDGGDGPRAERYAHLSKEEDPLPRWRGLRGGEELAAGGGARPMLAVLAAFCTPVRVPSKSSPSTPLPPSSHATGRSKGGGAKTASAAEPGGGCSQGTRKFSEHCVGEPLNTSSPRIYMGISLGGTPPSSKTTWFIRSAKDDPRGSRCPRRRPTKRRSRRYGRCLWVPASSHSFAWASAKPQTSSPASQ